MAKIDMSDSELSIVQQGLELLVSSVQRQLNKFPTGSALHTAYSTSKAEIAAVQTKLFALKGGN